MREKFDAVLERLAIDEDGVLTVDGMRVAITATTVLLAIQKEAERILGRGCAAILYRGGESAGRQFAERARARAEEAADPADLVANIMESVEARGFGRLEIASLDPGKGEGVLRLYRCPYAETAETGAAAACYVPAGFWAGLLSVFSGRHVVAEELQCRAKGDAHCEIAAVVAPP
jgi:predicted hydrocarbon binding protein